MSTGPKKEKKIDKKPYEKKVALNTTFADAMSLLADAANKKSAQRQASSKK
jgi:hypothetical protein